VSIEDFFSLGGLLLALMLLPLVWKGRGERHYSFSPWRNNADDTPMTPFTIYCQESLNQQKIPFEILF